MALAGDFRGLLLDRLAVTHLRLLDADVKVVIAQQAVLAHFQVQFAHPADQGLPGLLTRRWQRNAP